MNFYAPLKLNLQLWIYNQDQIILQFIKSISWKCRSSEVQKVNFDFRKIVHNPCKIAMTKATIK